jgi:hypothetical protein
VTNIHDKNDLKEIMSSWWIEDTSFFHKCDGIYNIMNVRESYTYVMDFMYRIYSREGCMHFKDDLIPIVHGIFTKRNMFNSRVVLSLELTNTIEKAQVY